MTILVGKDDVVFDHYKCGYIGDVPKEFEEDGSEYIYSNDLTTTPVTKEEVLNLMTPPFIIAYENYGGFLYNEVTGPSQNYFYVRTVSQSYGDYIFRNNNYRLKINAEFITKIITKTKTIIFK